MLVNERVALQTHTLPHVLTDAEHDLLVRFQEEVAPSLEYATAKDKRVLLERLQTRVQIGAEHLTIHCKIGMIQFCM